MRDYAELHRQVDNMVRASARVVVPLVNDLVKPRSVLDVGCGNAIWLAEFRTLGATDSLGIDGDYLDPAARSVPPDCFQEHDLTKRFRLGRKFDLVVSLEVAEHLPVEGENDLVLDLTRHGDVILFSAAIPGQGGWHHVNEQWASHWAAKFARLGYVRVDAVRPKVWSNPDVAFWYAQNTFLYVNEVALPRHPKLAGIARESSQWPVDAIHPVLFRDKVTQIQAALPPARPPYGVRELIGELPGAVARYVGKRVSSAA